VLVRHEVVGAFVLDRRDYGALPVGPARDPNARLIAYARATAVRGDDKRGMEPGPIRETRLHAILAPFEHRGGGRRQQPYRRQFFRPLQQGAAQHLVFQHVPERLVANLAMIVVQEQPRRTL
jgi:hypothetical protein